MADNLVLRQKSRESGTLNLMLGCSRIILAVTATFLAAGAFTFAAWRITKNDAWIDIFFQVPGALLMVLFAAVALGASVLVIREFSPGQSLRTAWQFITIAAACDLAGSIASHILGANRVLDVLRGLEAGSGPLHHAFQQFGFVVGGGVRFTLLAVGLFCTLGAYRRTRFLARLALIDWFLLALVFGYVLREFWDLALALQDGKQPNLAEVLGWPVDPLLCILLAEAILLYRSASQMGHGWIGNCWKAFAVGVGLIALGNFASWATNYGYLPYPWSAIGWYVWLPAESAFALGPIYQLEAIYRAHAQSSPPMKQP